MGDDRGKARGGRLQFAPLATRPVAASPQPAASTPDQQTPQASKVPLGIPSYVLASAGAAPGGIDPALEATLLGILAPPVRASDVAAEHARIHSLATTLGAVPDEARSALLTRLSRVGAHDALAHAFTSRLHHATRNRLLAVLRGDAVPLPSPRDALSDEGFAAHVTGFDITPSPLVLHRRFAPSVTALIRIAGDYGPTADVDPVLVAVRALDGDGAEVGSERARWTEAEPRSDVAAIIFTSADRYTLAADVTRGGLVIAQRRDEIEVTEPTSDVDAAASLSAPQRKTAVDKLATQAATEPDPAARTRLQDDRNILDYVAARLPELPPPTPRPDPPDLVHLFDGERGFDASADPVFIQEQIELAYRDRGMAAVDAMPAQLASVAASSIVGDGSGPPQFAPSTFATEVVAPLLEAGIARFHLEVDEFQSRFATTATRITLDLLAESEQSARAELVRYGIDATTREHTQHVGGGRIDGERTTTTVEVGGGDTADAEAMTAAAATLAANQRVIDRMHARLQGLHDVQAARASGHVGAGAGAGAMHFEDIAPELLASAPTPEQLPRVLEALQRLTTTAEVAHDAQIAASTTKYPLLASYKRDAGKHVEVDAAALERLKGWGGAREIYDRVAPVLENAAKVREAIGGRFNVWKEPRIVQLAMTELLVAPGTLRGAMVDERVASESEGSWTDWALTVITVGLALLSAIPTGGSSAVAAVVATAAVADASLGVYTLADHVAQYRVDLAAAHTDLDRARALSATEPSLFWLAVDVIGTGVGLAQAAHAFSRIAHELATARFAALMGALTAAQIDEGSAVIHRVAREGGVSAEGAERADAELRALASDVPAVRATDTRARITPAHTDELARRIGVPVEIDATGRLKRGTQLHYAPGPNGEILATKVIAGADALVDDVLVHAAAVRRMTRYNGLLGKLRRLWDRLVLLLDGRPGVPRAGAAWESYQELAKLDDLIALRQAAKFGAGVVERAALDEEIEFFETMRAHHERVVAEAERTGELGEAAGHIDAPHWRDPLGPDDPSVRAMHEIEDPAADVPDGVRLPVAKPIDPAVPAERASSGFWADENARGNCDWYSDNAAVNRVTGGAPVAYRHGYPVLDPYTKATVWLAEMLGEDGPDFAAADAEMARRAGVLKADGTPNAAWFEKQRRAQKLTWHHNEDGVRMQLVPRDLHANIPHTGGASSSRARPKP